MKNDLSMSHHSTLLRLICILSIIPTIPCMGFSNTYFYELYLHTEYYNEPPGFPSKFALTPLISSFANKNCRSLEKRFSAGVIGSLRLAHHHAWIEFIAALGEERIRFNHQGRLGKLSRFGGDDFLIDIGYNFLLDKKGKIQLLLHWLTGIPTQWKVTLAEIEEPLFGTRTLATGPVIEFAYDFVRNEEQDFFIGVICRFLHQFKRSYQPILPPNVLFNPGNSLNVLSSLHYRYYGHHIEFGYVYILLSNPSYLFPRRIEQFPSEKSNLIYFNYAYYHDQLSMSFEAGIANVWGKTSDGIVAWGTLAWYF